MIAAESFSPIKTSASRMSIAGRVAIRLIAVEPIPACSRFKLLKNSQVLRLLYLSLPLSVRGCHNCIDSSTQGSLFGAVMVMSWVERCYPCTLQGNRFSDAKLFPLRSMQDPVL